VSDLAPDFDNTFAADQDFPRRDHSPGLNIEYAGSMEDDRVRRRLSERHSAADDRQG
jgi:hypothetical protein